MTAQKENELQTSQEARRAKDTEYQNVDKAHARLLADYESLAETQKKLEGTIARLTQEKDALTTQKDAAVADMQKAKGEMNDSVTEQHRVQSLLDTANADKGELEKRLVAMGEDIENKNLHLAAYIEKFGEMVGFKVPPPITAKVTNVSDDFNIVLLSVGSDDNVKVGFEFTVYRGSEYVGKVIVNKVEKDYCAGYSKKELQRMPIMAGDDAKTRF